MKLRLAFLAALALAGVEAPAAMAIPLAPLMDGVAAPSAQEVGWRCGPGWRVDPWGRCVPHRRPPPPAYGVPHHPPAYGVPRHAPPYGGPRPGFRCGPGFHPNPWGRCVPNRW